MSAPNAADGADRDNEIAWAVREILRPALANSSKDVPPVNVVDIGANPIDGDPPYRSLLDAGLCSVTGFEPQRDALEALYKLASANERYLPYAVGDGSPHTLFHCETSGFASLLEPDERQLELLIDFPRLARVTARESIETQRLDDIAEVGRIDLLKIDIQGGELSVLRNGRETLAEAVAVHTEVGFHRLYRDQPTFADVDLELRDQGFVPHCFVSTRTWPMAPVQWADPLQLSARQLVEADVLYVRDPVRIAELDHDQVARLVLITDVVYHSYGLALRGVLELIRRGVLVESSEKAYRLLATARLPT